MFSNMSRILRLLRNPAAPIQRRVKYFLERWKYARNGGYRSETYWHDRLSKYGLDKRGVGIWTRTQAENEAMYEQARAVFIDFCHQHDISFKDKCVLEIGCGTGFYTDIVRGLGCADYTGLDITDALFPTLRDRFPGFEFVQQDITTTAPSGTFDAIVMIDVTQHIVDDDKFRRAMSNVASHLDTNGVFVVTSFLSTAREQNTFYHVRRPIENYKECFAGAEFLPPVPFRDKFLFAIRPAPSPGTTASQR